MSRSTLSLIPNPLTRCLSCDREAGIDDGHRVCAFCGWRPPCLACGKPIAGNVRKKHCNEVCRRRFYDQEHRPSWNGPAAVVQWLAKLDDPTFREVMRCAMSDREHRRAKAKGVRPDSYGRFRLRWALRAHSGEVEDLDELLLRRRPK